MVASVTRNARAICSVLRSPDRTQPLVRAPRRASRGVLKVRHGVIEEIGIANRSLTSGRGARRLLAGLN